MSEMLAVGSARNLRTCVWCRRGDELRRVAAMTRAVRGRFETTRGWGSWLGRPTAASFADSQAGRTVTATSPLRAVRALERRRARARAAIAASSRKFFPPNRRADQSRSHSSLLPCKLLLGLARRSIQVHCQYATMLASGRSAWIAGKARSDLLLSSPTRATACYVCIALHMHTDGTPHRGFLYSRSLASRT